MSIMGAASALSTSGATVAQRAFNGNVDAGAAAAGFANDAYAPLVSAAAPSDVDCGS